jgi:hypothetical protein
MKTLLLSFLGLVLGYVAGVVLGLTVECTPYFRANPSNLCGLVALWVYGPIAALVGLVGGGVLGRK